MASLIRRASGSLAVKALPALYGLGLIFLVVRVLPLGDFGRYGMAIAYMNLVSALSRGLWGVPLVIYTARGDRDLIVGPAFIASLATAFLGALAGILVLGVILDVGLVMAVLTGLMLVVLVPRDISLGLMQAEGRAWTAFWIEVGYFVGSLAGFVLFSRLGLLQTAEAALGINLGAAVLSAIIGVSLEPRAVKFRTAGDYKGMRELGKPVAMLTIGEMALQQGDVLIVGLFFTPEVIAPYVAARTLLRMYGLLSQSVNFLVLPSASRHMASGQLDTLRHRLRTILLGMMAFLVVANIFVFYISPWLFPFALGEKYNLAIPFFQVLIFATFFEPWYSILTNALAGIGKPRVTFRILAAAAILNIALNWLLLTVVGSGLGATAWVLVFTYLILAVGSYGLARRHGVISLVNR